MQSLRRNALEAASGILSARKLSIRCNLGHFSRAFHQPIPFLFEVALADADSDAGIFATVTEEFELPGGTLSEAK